MIKHLYRAIALPLLLLISAGSVCAQNEIDSLKRILPGLENERRVDVLNELASYLSYTEPEKADSLLVLSQTMINRLNYGKGQTRKWLVQATLSNFRSAFDQSDSLLNLAIDASEQTRDSTGLANIHMTFGTMNARRGNLAQSIEHFLKSLKIASAIKNFELECNNLINIGLINMNLGDLEKARDFLLKARDMATEHNFKYRLAQSYLNLGLVMYNLGDVDTSIGYIKQALSVFRLMGDKRGEARASGNLAFAYSVQGQYEKALKSYEQTLKTFELLEDPVQALKARLNISKIHVRMSYFERALNQIEIVLQRGQSLDDLSIKSDALKLRLDIYEKTNKYKPALEALKQLNIVKDSIDKRADKARFQALQTEFESERKDVQLRLNKQKIELLEKESQLSGTRQYLLVLTIVLLVFSVFFLRYLYIARLKRSRSNEQKALDQGEKIEKHNTELTGVLREKSLELNEYASLLADHQEELAHLKNTLQENKTDADVTYLNEASRSLNRKDVELLNWQDFRLKFDEVHTDFVVKLNTVHPRLTPREIDLCILLKVSVPNTEISQILEITYDGVKKAIRRTYKKMALSSAEELRNYILQLN